MEYALKNKYEIYDLYMLGIVGIEVRGDSFCYEDLYALAGKDRFVVTFNIRPESESYINFGKSITGKILYNHKKSRELTTRPNLANTNYDKVNIDPVIIRNSKPEPIQNLKYYEEPHISHIDLKAETNEKLKYHEGLPVSHIESIFVLQLKPEEQFTDKGEKKVPNILKLKIDYDKSIENTYINKLRFLTIKFKNNIRLISFEKEELVGIILALNDKHIDSRILQLSGFDQKTILSNLNIFHTYYEVKERQGLITDDEKEHYKAIKSKKRTIITEKLLKEINESRAKSNELSSDIFKEIINLAVSFKPSILLHGKMQVYWDIDSYIHIITRHVYKYQVGIFKDKTPFSYCVNDLKTLIEKVLNIVKKEYQLHYSRNPKKTFTRQGSMAVEFNGNHYNIRIDADGRLTQFHAL